MKIIWIYLDLSGWIREFTFYIRSQLAQFFIWVLSKHWKLDFYGYCERENITLQYFHTTHSLLIPICANKITFNSSLCIDLICSWVMWYVQCRINMQLSLIGRLNLSRGLGWNVDLDWERKIGKCFVIILLVCHRLSLFFLPLGIVCQWKQFLEALLTHRHFLQTTPDIKVPPTSKSLWNFIGSRSKPNVFLIKIKGSFPELDDHHIFKHSRTAVET